MTSSSPIVARSRARQAAALQAAEGRVVEIRGQREGRSRTQLAAELGMSYDQYGRYVSGVTPLRFDQIELFARLYGIDVQVLGRAILTGDVSEIVTPWDFRAELERAYPDLTDGNVEQWYALGKDQPEAVQRGYVVQADALYRAASEKPAARCAEERAEYRAHRTGT